MAYVCLVPVLSVHQRRSAARSAACLRRREAYLPRTGTVIVRGPELVGGCGGGGERKCRARAFPMCASGEGRRSQSGSCVCARARAPGVRERWDAGVCVW